MSEAAGFSSIWFVLSQQGYALAESRLNTVAGALFVLACAAIAALAWRAPRRPRLAQLTLLVVAAFLLTNKVYSPQYVLWLIPLAALARPRWRDLLIWQAGEAIHFVGIWMLIAGYPPGNANRALGEDGYGVTVLAHIAGTLWLVAMVVRDILRPESRPRPPRRLRRPGRRRPRPRPRRPPHGIDHVQHAGGPFARRAGIANRPHASVSCQGCGRRGDGRTLQVGHSRSSAIRDSLFGPDLLAVAESQRGVFTSAQAYAAGHSQKEIQRLRGKHLESIRRGVYAWRDELHDGVADQAAPDAGRSPDARTQCSRGV